MNSTRCRIRILTKPVKHMKKGDFFRWEMVDEITKSINAGTTLIVDRYAFREVENNTKIKGFFS